ncbi:MAG TPA: winged helix-turn-helix domain-containing protein [Ktedonobacterales bacterium]
MPTSPQSTTDSTATPRAAETTTRVRRAARQNPVAEASATSASSARATAAQVTAAVAATLRVGRLQLGRRLDDIERELMTLAAQPEQTATTRRVASAAHGGVERARSAIEAFTLLVALPHQPLRLAPVEISDLLMSALARWKTRSPRHTFELALPGTEPTLLGDTALIAQAIEGLVAWAAAHSGPGDIRVSLLLAHAPDASDALTIAVHCPLHEANSAQPERVFEPADEPQADGAGDVELTLTRAIAERHGGRAWAEVDLAAQAITLAIALAATPPTTAPRIGQATADLPERAEAPGALPALARARSVVAVAHGDARMARYLRANLEEAGFSAKTATTLDAALKLIEVEEPDLILLDLALPDERGRDPLARALARTLAPVIALGSAVDADACARSLDAGAVDFIAQPLSIEEALARARRALRPMPGQEASANQRVYTCGDLVIDDAQRLVTVAGAPAALSKTEYRLLRALAQNPGKTLSHEALLARVWGPAYRQEIEFVWVYIRRLRRKIEPDPAHPRYILTAPGVGYRLAQPSSQ